MKQQDDDYLRRILEAAGVAVALHDTSTTDADLVRMMQVWLGITDDAFTIESTTVEDVDLDDSFYQLVTEWLVHVWQPSNESSNTTLPSNTLLESDVNSDCITLDQVWESVRVVRWLRHWMELHVSTTRSSDDEKNDTADNSSLSQRLLQQPGWEPLVRALFYYIQYLPVLQSQIDRYSTTLQQQQRTSSSSVAAAGPSGASLSVETAASRVQHYQAAQVVAARLRTEWEEHLQRLEIITGEWYLTASAKQRRTIRKCLGQTWSQFVRGQGATTGGLRQENTKAAGIKLTLSVLHRILLGLTETPGPAYQHLLNHHLMPLHRVQGMVLWRDQTAVLELYHEPLTVCIAVLMQKEPTWIPPVLVALLDKEIFPATGNTPKQVLLLHEIDTYVGLLSTVDETKWQELVQDPVWVLSLLQVTARCMASDHSRVAERALSLFKNADFERLLKHRFDTALAVLLPALVKKEPSWNPTVRKMTYHVLMKLQGYDEAVFAAASQRVFSASIVPAAGSSISQQRPPVASKSSIVTRTTDNTAPINLSLKAGMGTWRPPMLAKRRTGPGSMPPPFTRPRTGQPPATVTGVAPWAMGVAQPAATSIALPSKASLPPLAVTGVAPWAMKTPPTAPTSSHKRRAPNSGLPPMVEEAATKESSSTDDSSLSGLERVVSYMQQIKPPEEEHGASYWSQAQMAETPTLLPNLKFHDLVFGHNLGTGAFGSVRYARLIDKTKTRSHWPEYAVKIVSTEKIHELGYESSIQREIAVLRVLSHPGIARLVSSFRFREGAYLVLEYASGGDLHTLLRKHGSLDNESTRFVMGEVVAALASVHDLGLVYADLKPENVVITETGHVKLTDFGGSRPVTKNAKDLIKSIAKDILKTLRNGGWREQNTGDAVDVDDLMEEDALDSDEEDTRIEGTTAYLPPEVVMGAFPTITADSWALGCVLYQCLSGRPPLLESDDASTRHRIVSFDAHEPANVIDRLFEDKHASGIVPDARELIKCLLERDPLKRPGMQQTAQHSFFTSANVDCFNLHLKPAYPLDVGDVSPTPDATWSRRQFSSIWAPQPVAYNISLPTEEETLKSYEQTLTAPISEGEEAAGFFSTTAGQLSHTLGNISERAPQNPSHA